MDRIDGIYNNAKRYIEQDTDADYKQKALAWLERLRNDAENSYDPALRVRSQRAIDTIGSAIQTNQTDEKNNENIYVPLKKFVQEETGAPSVTSSDPTKYSDAEAKFKKTVERLNHIANGNDSTGAVDPKITDEMKAKANEMLNTLQQDGTDAEKKAAKELHDKLYRAGNQANPDTALQKMVKDSISFDQSEEILKKIAAGLDESGKPDQRIPEKSVRDEIQKQAATHLETLEKGGMEAELKRRRLLALFNQGGFEAIFNDIKSSNTVQEKMKATAGTSGLPKAREVLDAMSKDKGIDGRTADNLIVYLDANKLKPEEKIALARLASKGGTDAQIKNAIKASLLFTNMKNEIDFLKGRNFLLNFQFTGAKAKSRNNWLNLSQDKIIANELSPVDKAGLAQIGKKLRTEGDISEDEIYKIFHQPQPQRQNQQSYNIQRSYDGAPTYYTSYYPSNPYGAGYNPYLGYNPSGYNTGNLLEMLANPYTGGNPLLINLAASARNNYVGAVRRRAAAYLSALNRAYAGLRF